MRDSTYDNHFLPAFFWEIAVVLFAFFVFCVKNKASSGVYARYNMNRYSTMHEDSDEQLLQSMFGPFSKVRSQT